MDCIVLESTSKLRTNNIHKSLMVYITIFIDIFFFFIVLKMLSKGVSRIHFITSSHL